MIKISAIILAYNSENVIAGCLDSISFCDEIIVIDNGSTDRTKEIVKRAGAKVITCTTDNFAEKRNFGLKEARGEWILYVDTDERISPSLREGIIQYTNLPHLNRPDTPVKQASSFQSALKGEENPVAYRIKRKNFYLGNHEWPKIEKLERLFRKDKLKEWYGKLHESPKIDGKIGELDGFLLHYTHTDLSSMVNKTLKWSEVEAENRFQANHPKMTWWRFPRVMLTAFFDSYIQQGGWKVGTVGLIESMYQAFSMFVTYARLWERQNSV